MSIEDFVKLHWMAVERLDCTSPFVCFNDGDGDGDGDGGGGDGGDDGDDGGDDGEGGEGDESGEGEAEAEAGAEAEAEAEAGAEAEAAAESDPEADPEADFDFDSSPGGYGSYGSTAGYGANAAATAADLAAALAEPGPDPAPDPASPEPEPQADLPEIEVVGGPVDVAASGPGGKGGHGGQDDEEDTGGLGGFGGLGGLGSALGDIAGGLGGFVGSAGAAELGQPNVRVGDTIDTGKAQDRPGFSNPQNAPPVSLPTTPPMALPTINVSSKSSRGRETSPDPATSPAPSASPSTDPFDQTGPFDYGSVGFGTGLSGSDTGVGMSMAQDPRAVPTDRSAGASFGQPEIVVNALPVALPGRGRGVPTTTYSRDTSNRDKIESPPLSVSRGYVAARGNPDFQFENLPGMTIATNYSPGFQQSPSQGFQSRSQGVPFDPAAFAPGTAPETGPAVAGTQGTAPGGVAGATAGATTGGVAGAGPGGVAGGAPDVGGGDYLLPQAMRAMAQQQLQQERRRQRDAIAKTLLDRSGGTGGW